MDTVKKYTNKSPVWHEFYQNRSTHALCGTVIPWYAPNTEQWREDEEGVKSRRHCGRCKIITSKTTQSS